MDKHAARIAVGYDGSESAGTALDWAAAQAERHNLPLSVVTVVDYVGMLPGVYGPSSPTLFQEEAKEIAERGEQRARKSAASIDIITEPAVGQVAENLIRLSASADRLVVGNRGHGEVSGTLLGSVGFAVSAHAHCPVVVVRGDTTAPGPQRPVMVGVDDSPGARAALRYAADRAAEAGAPLIVATTYRLLSPQVWAEYGPYYSEATAQAPTYDAMARENAAKVASAAAQQATEQHPNLTVRESVSTGSPAHELVRNAGNCALLVVGTRGHGGFAGLLLGSVSHDVIHSAPCPVAIIPTEEQTPPSGQSDSDR